MNEVPCIGFGITVLYSLRTATTQVFERGRSGFMKSKNMRRRSFSDKPRLLRAYVTSTMYRASMGGDTRIAWKSGKVTGEVWLSEEFETWVRGHGPQARLAFLSARALETR